MTQLLMAVDELHKEGIYHRDLKPQNILVLGTEWPSICITDFGLAASSS
jgi:serine/threonine protein kinase